MASEMVKTFLMNNVLVGSMSLLQVIATLLIESKGTECLTPNEAPKDCEPEMEELYVGTWDSGIWIT